MFNKILGAVFGGSETTKAIQAVATEWIQTDTEKAEAKTLMIKALDPNGEMRRELSRRVAALYTIYIITALLLLVLESFTSLAGVATATVKLTELFIPITTLFGTIVSASFGVNYKNAKAEQ